MDLLYHKTEGPIVKSVESGSRLVVNWILDLVFPVRCIECGEFGNYMCRRCLNSIKITHSFECIGCKKVTSLGKTCYFCKDDNYIDQLFAATEYRDKKVSKILKFTKYRFIPQLVYPAFSIIKKYIKWLGANKKFNVFGEQPIIIPIPLHRERYNWRGFNQSEILAKFIADIFLADINLDVLKRTKKSKPQVEVSEREDRLKNVTGLFSVFDKNLVNGRTILLIDDVCTTGATLNEAAKVLKENGASKVTALVVAR